MARPFLSSNLFSVHGFCLMVISSSLSDEQLLNAIHNSAIAYSRLVNQVFLLVGKNKGEEMLWFQCSFPKKNFMHLLGIKSTTLSADEFFEKAVQNNIGLSDCAASRKHNRSTINEKCSCCEDLLDFNNAKYFRIGKKDNISQFVDFAYSYGSSAILGFQTSTDNLCYPISLIPNDIEQFSSKTYRVIFVCSKDIESTTYHNPFIEIKKGLFSELLPSFPPELKELFTQEKGPA